MLVTWHQTKSDIQMCPKKFQRRLKSWMYNLSEEYLDLEHKLIRK